MALFYIFILFYSFNFVKSETTCYNETNQTCEITTSEYFTTNILNINTTWDEFNETEADNITETYEENFTKLTTKQITTSTATPLPETTTVKNKRTKTQLEETFRVLDNICTCDLIIHSCDINCCCDPDCTYHERQIFKGCLEIPEFLYDTRYCYQSEIIYLNNTKYKMIKSNEGLFCIVKDNIKKQLKYPNRPIIYKEKLLDKLIKKNRHYQWDHEIFVPKVFNSSIKYQLGSPIWSILNKTTLEIFQIPARFGGAFCRTFSSINFLEEKEYSCFLLINQDTCKDKMFNSQSYFQQHFLISNPYLLKNPENLNFSQCLTTTCLKIHSFYCSNIKNTSLENCTSLNKFPAPVLDKYCQNITQKVVYLLYHNGTNGLINASVFIWLSNSARSITYHKLDISVHFVWAQNTKPLFKRSGAPGYKVGAPILAGHKVFNTVGDDELEAIALSQNPNDWLTLPASNFQGLCDLETRIPVSFGENRRVTCILNTINITTCQEMHTSVLQLLIGDIDKSEERFVASYGDSSIHKTGDWVPIRELTSIPSPPTKSEKCRLPTTTLHFDIVWARIGSFSNPQAKIIGVAQRLGTHQVDVSTISHVHIAASVNFIEVTRPAKTEFAQLPVYELKLPHDFFYPFLSRTSMGSRFFLNYYLIIFIYLYKVQ